MSTILTRSPIMTRAGIEHLFYHECGYDLDTFEAKSHKTLDELLEAVNKRDVTLEVERFKGVLVPSQKSVKAEVEITIPYYNLWLCEIGRLYEKDGYYDERFQGFGVRETCWPRRPVILAARLGLLQECHIKTRFRELVTVQEPLVRTNEAVKSRWSSVYYRVRSRTIGFTYRLSLTLMPTHHPFGDIMVELKDGSVRSRCEWMSQTERDRRLGKVFIESNLLQGI